MDSCDALIVGGGPAGSSCARRLAGQGLDVVVMDKAAFPRDKVCAGWITPEVLQTLEIDAIAYAGARVLQPIRAFRTGLIDGRTLETQYPGTVSFGIRRREFDDYLLARSGARLRLGEPVKSLARQGSRWIVNGAVTTPMLVGAGGHFCPVARHLGAKFGVGNSVVTAQEIEFAMAPTEADACQVRADTPELYFCQDLKGYGWCFRKGDHLNIGLGRDLTPRLGDELERFCAFLRQGGKIPRSIPGSFRGHAYLMHGHGTRKLLDDGVLLVGDAAGLAYPHSGEGIRPAIESGLMAAATILEAGGDYRARCLQAYGRRLSSRYGPLAAEHREAGMVRTLIARVLLGNPWFTRHVVLDRWFLHSRQAAMTSAA